MGEIYNRLVLTVIAVALLVLTGERLLRGQVEIYHAQNCGGAYDPCHVVIENRSIKVETEPSSRCGENKIDRCFVEIVR